MEFKRWIYICGFAVPVLLVFAIFRPESSPIGVYKAQSSSVVLVEPYIKPTLSLFGYRISLPWSHRWAHGSGVILDRKGTILTAGHVGAISSLFLITAYDGSVYEAGLLAVDPRSDLALLQPVRGAPRGFTCATIGQSVVVGEEVICIGHPGGFRWLLTAGVVSSLEMGIVVSDTVVNPGSSGGPLFSLSGKLVGITSGIVGPMKHPFFQGHSIFVGTDDIRAFLDRYGR